MIYRPTARLFLAAILSLTASHVLGGDFVEHNGSALNGYDPLSYFTSSAYPTLGASQLSYTYMDSKFYFLTPGHLRTFASNPEQYAPQFRGYDAYGVSQGLKIPAHPRVFKVVNGKLYLFADSEARKNWTKDIEGNIVRATERWPDFVKLAIDNN